MRSDDGGSARVCWRKLLSGWVVGADDVSCWQLLWCELGQPERVLLGQLLSRGIGEPVRLRCQVLLPQRDGGACVPDGIVVSCRQRERAAVPRRTLLPDARLERTGVHGVELLPCGVDGDDELHGGVLLPRGRDGEPCAVQRGVLLPCGGEQPDGVWCGDVLSERGDV